MKNIENVERDVGPVLLPLARQPVKMNARYLTLLRRLHTLLGFNHHHYHHHQMTYPSQKIPHYVGFPSISSCLLGSFCHFHLNINVLRVPTVQLIP